jgi:aminopeptidase-like protein
LLKLEDGDYEVCIDSSLENGNLTYGELYLPGARSDEFLISCHVCHPSLCNDNLSGIAVATFLAKQLQDRSRRHSFRFLFIPATIGAVTWLSLNEASASRIKHGIVLASVGDPGSITYKRSRQGDAEIDRAFQYVLRRCGDDHAVAGFTPYGYDERQYCSPGFDLPVGGMSRTPYGRYPEYHTSADNLDFVGPAFLADSFEKCMAVIDVIESNRTWVNLRPKGEPQLGRHGVYRPVGVEADASKDPGMALLWVLNLADGSNSLLDVAERSEMDFGTIREAAQALHGAGLLQER